MLSSRKKAGAFTYYVAPRVIRPYDLSYPLQLVMLIEPQLSAGNSLKTHWVQRQISHTTLHIAMLASSGNYPL